MGGARGLCMTSWRKKRGKAKVTKFNSLPSHDNQKKGRDRRKKWFV